MNRKQYVRVTGLFVAMALVASPAAGGLLGFLQVGSIEGDATMAGHEEWSTILSYNISVQNAGWRPDGGDTIPAFSDMYVTKSLDRGSPYYFGAAVVGMQFDEAKLDIVNADQPSHLYVQWLFEDAVISAYNTVFDAGQSLELLAIDFRRVTYKYTPADETGRATGFMYDRYTNAFNWIGAPPANFVLLAQFTEASAPEPAGMVLAAIGAIAALCVRRRRGTASGAVSPQP